MLRFIVFLLFCSISSVLPAPTNEAPHWETDGTPELIAEGNVVTFQTGGTGSPANAIWKDGAEGVSSGTHYWNFKVLDGGDFFVGLTDLDKFKQGWGLDGLMYGGNLADGGALLEGNFGPWLKQGDNVGMLLKFEDGKLKVYFFVNERSLGLAYDLDENVLNGAFPVVSMDEKVSVSIEKSSEIPSNLEREPEVFGNPLMGHWKLINLKSDGNSKDLVKGATLSISADDDDSFASNYINADESESNAQEAYAVSLHVVNSIFYTWIHKTDGTWVSVGGMTTLVGGSPDVMQFEFELSSLIGSADSIEENNGELLVAGGGKESIWKKFDPEVRVITQNPFAH